ncbi:MAG: efflux RND transporter periplasmic adaptor subunit [Verrucomicrobia bacterium]|nr:efflux RND transporter periplasmic adaptor subunit [Verrucomicrobiota bacterium]
MLNKLIRELSRWPCLLVMCGGGDCLLLHGADSKPASAVEVKFVHPKPGDITRHITLPATVKAFQQAVLCAKVAGYLKTITVDKGDTVKEGDWLADIEVPELIADLAKFKTEAEVAKIDFERTVEAQKKAPDLVVPQTVDNARGKYEVAKASLERIEKLLGFAKITAPFSGVVTMRYVDPGAFIPVATSGSAANTAALITLMDFNKVRVQVAVPEPEVPLTAKGQPVTVSVEELPGRSFRGEITRIAYALDEATKTMLVEAELPNPKWELRPGMFAQIKIGVERKTGALLVPIGALVVERGGNSLFTVVDNQAKKVAVKTGFNDGTTVEILSGATPEDRVILVGKQALAPGQPVNAVEAR